MSVRRSRPARPRATAVVPAATVVWLLAVGTMAWAAPTPGSREVAPLVDKALADKRHRFCHDRDYPLTPRELEWCPLVRANPRHCPALVAVCAAGARAQEHSRRSFDLDFDFDLPNLPLPGKLLMLALLAALVGFLLYQLIRSGGAGRARVPGERPVGATVGGTRVDPTLAQVVETDVLRLLDAARAAAAAGDHRRAVELAYAALLRKLEGTGLIRVEAHRTNGDYLRDLSQRSPGLRPRVKEVVHEVERVEFGGEPPGEDHFRWIHDRVTGLVTERIGALLLVLGLLAGGAGCAAREGWDDSPSGRSALRQMLNDNHMVVRERVRPLAALARSSADPADQVDTLVLLPDAELSETDWSALSAWVETGHTLVVAGNPRRGSDWLTVTFSPHGLRGSHPLTADAAAKQWYGNLQVTVPVGTELVRPSVYDRWTRLLSRGGEPYALMSRPSKGRLVVFADDWLFCNAALLAPGNARFLTALLSERGPRVQFAGGLESIVSQTPVTAVSRGRLAPALLQLGAAALLFFLFRGAHFGLPRAEVAAGRRAFVDHVRALGLVYARAKAGRVSLEHYGTWATERLAERLRLRGARRLSAIAEALSFRTGRPVGEVMRLLVEARGGASDAAAGDRARDDAEAMVTLRALAALVAETGVEGTKKPGAGRQA